jgi:hypothetical protein
LTRRDLLIAGSAALGAGLTACETPPRQRFADLTYGHFGQFRLDVAAIEIVSEYQSPLAPPHIEHLLPAAPEQTLRRWARDRLVATGAAGYRGRFVITDARVTETKLAKTEGIRGAFTTDQAERYDGAIAAALEIRAERGNFRDGYAAASASRLRTVPEGISINARETVWFELVETLMNDFNAEMERQIRANLTRFLRQ